MLRETAGSMVIWRPLRRTEFVEFSQGAGRWWNHLGPIMALLHYRELRLYRSTSLESWLDPRIPREMVTDFTFRQAKRNDTDIINDIMI